MVDKNVAHTIKVTVKVELGADSVLTAIIRFMDDGKHEVEVLNPLVWKFTAVSPCYMFQHNDTQYSVNPRNGFAMSVFPSIMTDSDREYSEKAIEIINKVYTDIPDDKIYEEYEALVKEKETSTSTGST